MEIDAFDRKIMAILAGEGRITLTELADRIGLTKTPTQARVKRLEAEGYIMGYRAMLNPVKIGLDHVAFVEVTLSDTRDKALKSFNEAVSLVGEIEQAHLIAGSFDYLLKIRTRSISDYRQMLGETLSALPHVASTSTFVVMESVKENAV